MVSSLAIMISAVLSLTVTGLLLLMLADYLLCDHPAVYVASEHHENSYNKELFSTYTIVCMCLTMLSFIAGNMHGPTSLYASSYQYTWPCIYTAVAIALNAHACNRL